MPSLQVRDLPEAIYHKLQMDARREQRSLSQQAMVTLKKGLEIDENPQDRRRKLVERLLSDPTSFPTDEWKDPVNLIREDRER